MKQFHALQLSVALARTMCSVRCELVPLVLQQPMGFEKHAQYAHCCAGFNVMDDRILSLVSLNNVTI